MANPEGGLFGFLKKLFAREGERKAAKKVKQEQRPEAPKEEKKEKRNKVKDIIQELERVTSSHPAREILGSIRFQEKTIADHPDLGNLLLDIIHTVNRDPGQYHDPKWLQDKIRRLGSFSTVLANSSDLGNLQAIEQNIENIYSKSQRDRREEEVRSEVEQIRTGGENVPQIQPPADSSGPTPTDQNWLDFVPNEYKGALEQALADAQSATGEDFVQAQQKFARSFANAKREAVKKIKPGNEGAIKEYQNLDKAFEIVASQFVEKNPREGGRLMDAQRTYGFDFMEKKIQSDENYRDYWFYHIIENVLYSHKGEPHRELYQLYETSDMHDFLDIVRRIKGPNGEAIGLKYAERYDQLKNTIFQSHDMDYYAAHPQQDMKEFIGSTSLFLNTYIDAAVQDPMVSLAKRLYESALLHIRETNNGYIPREWLQWQEGKLRASKLDEMVEEKLREAIKWNQLYVTKVDDVTGLPAPSVWNRKQIDPTKPYTMKDLYGDEPAQSEDWRRTMGDLKIASALKQAKGLSLVDQRMLEIIALSKGTGTDFYDKSVSAFNSVPYEGIVRHIEPIIHYFGRYKVGMDVYDAFFNTMITDNPHWDPEHMKQVIKLHYAGDHDALKTYAQKHNLGDVATRLNEEDNPFAYSGMWGTMTKWRSGDATAGFDDWEIDQTYAGALKLTTAGDSFSGSERKSSFQKWGGWAYRKARQYFMENNPNYTAFREEYRQRLLASNDIRSARIAEENGDEFEYHWRRIGMRQIREGRDTYESLLTADFEIYDNNQGMFPTPGSKTDTLIKQLERAYKARTWVQLTMRSPRVVAQELEVEWQKDGYGRTSPLRKKIIWEILGIDVDEIAAPRTPLATDEEAFNRIWDLEGAVAAISQSAIRNNRDLTASDFNVIDDETLKRQALRYWDMTREAMLGGMKDRAGDVYGMIGIKDATGSRMRGLRFNAIDWDKIKSISLESKGEKSQFIIPSLRTHLLNNHLIDRDWKHMFSTEDMGWEYLNVGALGERNPVRRAGDLGSHVEFGQLFEQYMNDVISRPKPKLDDIVELQHKMLVAMAGDFLDIGNNAVGRIAFTTGRIFQKADWAWKLPLGSGPLLSLVKDSSIAQMIHGRDRGDAWGPNEMLQYVQAVGNQILPRSKFSKMGGRELSPHSEWDRAVLGKSLGATKANAMYEIINMTIFIATMITIYRALTAKSEEEEE